MMKRNLLLLPLAFFFAACGPKSAEEPPAEELPEAPAAKTPEAPNAKTIAALDQGGVHFQIIDGQYEWAGLQPFLSMLGNMFMLSMEQASPEGIDPKVVDTLSTLPEKLGIKEMVARGSSTKELEQGGYLSKYILQSRPDATGWMWNLAGEEIDTGKRINQFPESTAVFAHYSVNGPLILSELQRELQAFPEADDGLKEGLRVLREESIPLEAFLNSLNSGVSFGVTLSDRVNWTLPLPGNPVRIPETGIVIMFSDPEETLKNYLVELLKTNPVFPVMESEDSGVPAHFIALPVPVSTAVSLQLAHVEGTTLICSSAELLKELVQRRNGETASPLVSSLQGLTRTRASNAIVVNPDLDRYFKGTFDQVFQMIEEEAGEEAMMIQPMMEFYGSLFASLPHVTLSRQEGDLHISEMIHRHPLSPQYSNNSVLMAPAVGGLLAAIAVPAFHKARTEAQNNACINHLRMIEGAKDQFAIENNLAAGAVVTEEQAVPYFPGGFPVCPAGGEYTIHPVDTPAECSLHGDVGF